MTTAIAIASMTCMKAAGGVVRHQLNGSESHDDSSTRVGWYIDQVKQLRK